MCNLQSVKLSKLGCSLLLASEGKKVLLFKEDILDPAGKRINPEQPFIKAL